MVSSSVYGFENELDQICPILEAYGYEVLNSHYNTIKVNPNLSNKENCLRAVEECDLFLGIIRPFCGTGEIGNEYITISEMKKAIELGKLYWFLAHGNVTFARILLRNIELKSGDEIIIKKNKHFHKESVEIYDYVTKNHIQDVGSRKGNWVPNFYDIAQVMKYIQTQFIDKENINQLINQQNGNNHY